MFGDDDLCFTAIRSALDIVAEEPITNTMIVDEFCRLYHEVAKQAELDNPTSNAFLENPLGWKNIMVSHAILSM